MQTNGSWNQICAQTVGSQFELPGNFIRFAPTSIEDMHLFVSLNAFVLIGLLIGMSVSSSSQCCTLCISNVNVHVLGFPWPGGGQGSPKYWRRAQKSVHLATSVENSLPKTHLMLRDGNETRQQKTNELETAPHWLFTKRWYTKQAGKTR
jgi:hypothetical protein